MNLFFSVLFLVQLSVADDQSVLNAIAALVPKKNGVACSAPTLTSCTVGGNCQGTNCHGNFRVSVDSTKKFITGAFVSRVPWPIHSRLTTWNVLGNIAKVSSNIVLDINEADVALHAV